MSREVWSIEVKGARGPKLSAAQRRQAVITRVHAAAEAGGFSRNRARGQTVAASQGLPSRSAVGAARGMRHLSGRYKFAKRIMSERRGIDGGFKREARADLAGLRARISEYRQRRGG